MTTYAQTQGVRSASATLTDVGDALDGLTTEVRTVLSDQAVGSTTSSSLVMIENGTDDCEITLSNVTADEVIEIVGHINFSGSSAVRAAFQIRNNTDAVNLDPQVERLATGTATSGRDDWATVTAKDTGRTGSVVYRLMWSTESGTIYSKKSYMQIRRTIDRDV